MERLWCDVSSLTLLTLLAVTPSFAQTKTQTGTDPADDPGRAQATKAPVLVEEVIVTGTRITRRDFQSPSPVYTLDSDAIQLQGYPTLDDMLNRLPQFSPDYGRSMGYKEVEFGIEESSINLRGLGAERTLVLLDGKRLGAGGSHGVINTNVLPSAMMERVEVLTGGASAVYGSDAMSGVVNFITRKDFTGFELTGNYEVTARSDADVGSLNVAAGSDFADGRGNISGFIDYYRREPLSAAERDFSRVKLVDDAFVNRNAVDYEPQGELVEYRSAAVPSGLFVFPTPLPGQSARGPVGFDANGDPIFLAIPEDLFNFAPYFNLQNELERTSGRVLVNYAFSDTLAGSIDFLGSHHEDRQPWSPTAHRLRVQTNLDNPLLTPLTRQLFEENFEFFDDGIAYLDLLRRFNELGEDARFVAWESDNWRIALSLEGEFDSGWSWQLDYQYAEQQTDIALAGGVDIANLRQGLLVDPATGECVDTSNGCVPVNIFGPGRMSAEAIDFISADVARIDSRSEIQQFLFFTEGAVDIRLPLSLGLGIELRLEQGSYDPDPALLAGDVAGYYAVAGIDGDFDMAEAFVEIALPLLRERRFAEELSLEAGLRYSDHSEVGDFWTWKTGISWTPVESLRLRAMFQRATRAPNLEEMFYFAYEVESLAGNNPGDPSSVYDPCSAHNDPVGGGHADMCVSQGIPADQVGTWVADPLVLRTQASSGNRELEPEKANTWTVGLVWQPADIEGLSVALDWYHIDIADALRWIGSRQAIDTCFQVGVPNSEYCRAFRRATDGNIEWELSTYRNLSELNAEGIDLQARYVTDAPGKLPGELRLSLLANRNLETNALLTAGATLQECAGLFGEPCSFMSLGAYPEYRAVTTFGYDLGDFAAQLQWHWIGAMDNAWTEYPAGWIRGNPLAVDRVDDISYFDLNASWNPTDSTRIIAGIINLTDRAPPMLGTQAGWFNTNSALYDTYGRRFHLTARWRF